jgi:hypothetical protein
MSKYSEIEKEFLDQVSFLDDMDTRRSLLNEILQKHPEITDEEKLQIRSFLDDVTTLAGLSKWAGK